MVKRIGITGGIGSGKSTVLKILRSLGYCTTDADNLVSQVVADPIVKDKISRLLGKESYLPDGSYNRQYIRELIFAKPELRTQLEGIIHPAVFSCFAELSAQLSQVCTGAWLFYEASLIVESQRVTSFDELVLVSAPEPLRLSRVRARSGLPESKIREVMSSQYLDEEKRKFASYEICNSAEFYENSEPLRSEVLKMVLHFAEKFSRPLG